MFQLSTKKKKIRESKKREGTLTTRTEIETEFILSYFKEKKFQFKEIKVSLGFGGH